MKTKLRGLCVFNLFMISCLFHSRGYAGSLDEFLNSQGYFLSPLDSRVNEGYCTFPQQREFIKDLESYEGIRKIAEIGFNAGHSAELFLKNCPSATLVSFDLNTHSYASVGAAFMEQEYPQRFQFIEGDSKKMVPSYAVGHPEEKFDLIYVDGGHSFAICYADILNCKKMASENCILWIDDYWDEVQIAVDFLESQNVIRVIEKKRVSDWYGDRSWVIATYVRS